MQFEKLASCPACEGPTASWRKKTVDGIDYHIERCADCGFAFVNPRPTLDFLMSYYGTHGHSEGHQHLTLVEVLAAEKVFPNSTLDADRLLRTADALLGASRPCRMLDVGCGYGFFSKAALDRGIVVDALELASTERGIATELTGLHPAAMSFEDYPEEPGGYDIVLMSQILEHAQDVNRWLEKCRTLLRKGGILIVALPNFDSMLRRVLNENDPWITPPAHLNFFSRGSLQRAFARHGIRLVEAQWASRVHPRALDRRLPPALSALKPLLSLGMRGAMGTIDRMGTGMMVTAYGVRE